MMNLDDAGIFLEIVLAVDGHNIDGRFAGCRDTFPCLFKPGLLLIFNKV